MQRVFVRMKLQVTQKGRYQKRSAVADLALLLDEAEAAITITSTCTQADTMTWLNLRVHTNFKATL